VGDIISEHSFLLSFAGFNFIQVFFLNVSVLLLAHYVLEISRVAPPSPQPSDFGGATMLTPCGGPGEGGFQEKESLLGTSS
jgi:hypothetical protein